MVYFFFYNNLNNNELFKKIHPYHTVKIGYIYVSQFNKENNELIIKDHIQNANANANPNKKLYGLFVHFELTLEEVLNKLEKIDEIKYKNRNTYILHLIKVHIEEVDNNLEHDAYIIY